MSIYTESTIITKQQSSPYSTYAAMNQSGRMRVIYGEIKDIILHDPIYKRWLIGDEKSRDWLYTRVISCFFIDDACWFDPSIEYIYFRRLYKNRILSYISERRSAERRKKEASAHA